MNKKEEVGGGIMLATFIVTSAILVIFCYAPVHWTLTKWNGLFEEKQPTISVENKEIVNTWDNYQKASHECKETATEYYKTHQQIIIYASSTSPEEQYKTYDCYAVKMELIK